MRPPSRTALWLLMAAGLVLAAAPADAGAPAARIVVAFANEPLAAPGPAGTTGSRYGGTGYRVGQSAQRQAHSVAAAYALREVTSWPIQVLSMHTAWCSRSPTAGRWPMCSRSSPRIRASR